MKKQFPEVNSQYGAPMGRKEYHEKPTSKTVSLFRINLNSGGYDDGGAYWGIGGPLYCARDEEGDYREFIRANSRKSAAFTLQINHLLKRKAY